MREEVERNIIIIDVNTSLSIIDRISRKMNKGKEMWIESNKPNRPTQNFPPNTRTQWVSSARRYLPRIYHMLDYKQGHKTSFDKFKKNEIISSNFFWS